MKQWPPLTRPPSRLLYVSWAENNYPATISIMLVEGKIRIVGHKKAVQRLLRAPGAVILYFSACRSAQYSTERQPPVHQAGAWRQTANIPRESHINWFSIFNYAHSRFILSCSQFLFRAKPFALHKVAAIKCLALLTLCHAVTREFSSDRDGGGGDAN